MSRAKCHSGLSNTLIRCNRKDQWLRYPTGGGYTDAIQIGNYKIETQEDDDDMRFLLWNPDRPCIAMVMDKKENLAIIDSIEYNPRCTVDGKMKRGEGTRDMIHTALRFLKQQGAKKIQLTDNSYILCKDMKVRLGLLYFFKTGQTWYEKYFGFRPEKKYLERYEKAKTLQKSLNLSEKPCDYFTEEVLDDLIARVGLVFFDRIVWELTT